MHLSKIEFMIEFLSGISISTDECHVFYFTFSCEVLVIVHIVAPCVGMLKNEIDTKTFICVHLGSFTFPV